MNTVLPTLRKFAQNKAKVYATATTALIASGIAGIIGDLPVFVIALSIAGLAFNIWFINSFSKASRVQIVGSFVYTALIIGIITVFIAAFTPAIETSLQVAAMWLLVLFGTTWGLILSAYDKEVNSKRE